MLPDGAGLGELLMLYKGILTIVDNDTDEVRKGEVLFRGDFVSDRFPYQSAQMSALINAAEKQVYDPSIETVVSIYIENVDERIIRSRTIDGDKARQVLQAYEDGYLVDTRDLDLEAAAWATGLWSTATQDIAMRTAANVIAAAIHGDPMK